MLDPQTVLLVYSLGEPRSRLTLFRGEASRSWALPGRHKLETAAGNLSQLWQERRRKSTRRAAELERRLAATLLGPALTELDGERLVIIAGGALAVLPFEALPDPREAPNQLAEAPARLLARHEIVQWPSVEAWIRSRSEPIPTRSGHFLAVIADPVFSGDDARLRRSPWLGGLGRRVSTDPLRSIAPLGTEGLDRLSQTLEEANDILRKVAATRLPGEPPLAALGFDANRELVLSGILEPYRFVHIATHGRADRPWPEGPSLVLSLRDRRGAQIPGVLSARDVRRLRLSADLVVLSGCKTGLAQPLEDGTQLSLGQAFLAAGARRVIVSLWDVGDRSTAELMDRLYDHLLRKDLPPVAALRAAQLSMASDPQWQHPSHWAGFVFQGDWR